MMEGKKRKISDGSEEKKNGNKKIKKEKILESIKKNIKNSRGGIGFMCPYLDTINRKVLDFDFQKVCSVSLNNFNVYACLVCGMYFQGRGKGTHAYLHSLEVDHHMFINLDNERIYCLPENYQVHETSLEDITYNLKPLYKRSDIRRFDREGEYYHALDGTDYLIGFMGLNNIKNTDWFNVSAQALAHVPMLRNYLLFPQNYQKKIQNLERKSEVNKAELVRKFGEFTRKIWNPRGFKGHVSPHEILQAISTASRKKFTIGVQADPIEFLAWFLNTVHSSMGGNKKRNSSIISQCFQGQVKVMTDSVVKKETRKIGPGQIEIKEQIQSKIQHKKFIYLSLDLPRSPLFKDNQDTNFIPQVPLFDLLQKFDGVTTETLMNGEKRRFQLSRLPRYLIIHYKRFTSNNWFKEKNPTLVNFPLYNLDMAPYVAFPERPTTEGLNAKGIRELREIMDTQKIDKKGCLNKQDLINKINAHYDAKEKNRSTRYDLIANICHDGTAKDGTYKAHILHRAIRTWYLFEDLEVKTNETIAQQVAQSECYIQIYELQAPGRSLGTPLVVKAEDESTVGNEEKRKANEEGKMDVEAPIKVKEEKV